MLERVPATAESAAQCLLRNAERPHRSYRLLDPKFWRHGGQDLDTPAWWPIYLNKVRAVPHSRPRVVTDSKSPGVATLRTQTSRWTSEGGKNVSYSIHDVGNGGARRYTQATRSAQAYAPQQVEAEYDDILYNDEQNNPPYPSYHDSAYSDSQNDHNRINQPHLNPFVRAHQGQSLFPLTASGEFTDYTADLTQYSSANTQPTYPEDEPYEPVEAPPTFEELRDIINLPQPRPVKDVRPARERGKSQAPLQRFIDGPEADQLEPPIESKKNKSLSARGDDVMEHKDSTPDTIYEEAWSLYVHSDNRAEEAIKTFELLSQSPKPRYKVRAITVLHELPEERRAQMMRSWTQAPQAKDFLAALDSEISDRQYESAIDVASQAAYSKVNLFPKLAAALIQRTLWTALGKLLARCHQDKTVNALISSMHDYSAEQKQRIPARIPAPFGGLLIECVQLRSLPASLTSLTRALPTATTIPEQNLRYLRSLRTHLKQLCVRSEHITKHMRIEDLHSMIDNRTESEMLHICGLRTIVNAPYTAGSAMAAFRIYQSLRQRHPAFAIRVNVLEQLLVLCAQDRMPVSSLLEVFEGCQALHHQRTKRMYNHILSACAKQGNVEDLKRLFDMYRHEHGQPDDLRILSPLVYVHAVSGDAKNAQREFDRIKQEFKMTPNTFCWNILLLAHARSEDPASAFKIRQQMSDAHILPDSHTYGTLLSVHAERGDTNAAIELVREVVESGFPITPVMSNTVVEAYLANDDIQTARQWVFETSKSMQKAGIQDPRTRLWNSLLRYYAFKADSRNFDVIEKSMRRRDITLDEMSYAASLALLVNTNKTDVAVEKLRWMAKTGEVAATQLHYSIVLAGLIKDKRRDMVTAMLHELEQQFPRIDHKVGELILRQQAERTHVTADDKAPDYSAAVALLVKLLSQHGASQQAASQGFLKSMLQSMVSRDSFQEADVLLKAIEPQRYSSNSIGLLVQSLKINTENSKWSVVNETWQKLFVLIRQRNLPSRPLEGQSASEDTPALPATVVSSEGAATPTSPSNGFPEVLADRRFALEEPLNYYMEAMARQHKQSELLRMLRDDFRKSGFALTGRNWNKLIQVLCRSNDPTHHVKAFEFSEQYMINRAQSWKLLMRGKLVREVFQPLTEASKAGEKVKPQYRTVDRLEAIATDRERRIPTYLTMIHLASVLERTQKHAARVRDRRQLDKIILAAPKTKRFLQQMPHSNDNLQRTILRGESAQEDAIPRPRSEGAFRRQVDSAADADGRRVIDRLSPEHLLEARTIFQEFGNQLADNDVKIQHAERWTGQISTEPTVLAGQGRMETTSESESRVRSQRRQKLAFFNAVMRELRHETVFVPLDMFSPKPTRSVSHSPEIVEGKADVASQKQPSQLLRNVRTAQQELRELAASKADKTESILTVRERLDRLAAEKSVRTEQLKARQLLGSTATKLAIPYAQLRRKRRNIAFKQRKTAAAVLELAYKQCRPETSERTFTRSKRFRQFIAARTRIRALRARRKDADLRKQGIDVPPTVGAQSPDVGPGELTRFRFVTPQRRSSRPQMHLSHRDRTLISIRKRMRRGQIVNNPKIPYTGTAFRYNMYRHRMRLLQRYYERRLESLPEDFDHKLRSEIYRRLQRVKLHLLRFGVARPDGSIDTDPWQQYLAAVKAGEYGDPTFWTARRLAEIDAQEAPVAASEEPRGPDVFTPLMYGKSEEEERQDALYEAEKQMRKQEIDRMVAEQAQYELEHKEEYEQLRAEKAAKEAELRGEGIYVPFAGEPEAPSKLNQAQELSDNVADDMRYVERGW